MAILAGFGNVGTIVAGTAAASVVVVGGVVGFQFLNSEPGTQDAPITQTSVAITSNTALLETDITPDTPTPDTPAIAPNLPSFDLVRVDADGSALVAGRAMPFSVVTVVIDGARTHTATADGNGSFAAIFSIENTGKPQVARLSMAIDGQEPIKSAATVILSPVLPKSSIRVADAITLPLVSDVEKDAEAPTVASDPTLDTVVVAALSEPTSEVLATHDEPAQKLKLADEVAENVSANEVKAHPVAIAEISDPAPSDLVPKVTTQVDVANIMPVAIDPVEPAIEVAVVTDVADVETVQDVVTPIETTQLATKDAVVAPIATIEDSFKTATDIPATVATDAIKPVQFAATDLSQDTVTSPATTQSPEVTFEIALLDDTTNAAPIPVTVEAKQKDVDAPQTPVIEVSNIAIGDSPSFGAPSLTNEGAPTVLASVEAPLKAVPTAPSAPSVLLADDTGIRVLQSGGDAPAASQTVIIDTISYDPGGDVALGGRGAGTGFVRVYLNNKPIKTTRIGIDGQWRTPLPEVDTGVYTLRVDEINEAGVVTSRMETPFKREEPEIVAALDTRQSDARDDTGIVTVQPGNTLWGIATQTYGDGLLYVRVFEANRERIRNADLIYPGQIFEIPN